MPKPRNSKSKDKPIVVNGIEYTNEEELDKRRKADAAALAEFLYDMYKKKPRATGQ